MADFATARTRMVDNQLRTSNVTDRRVLSAMGDVPREAFLPSDRAALAYADVTHSLGNGRSLAAPAPFAKLLQLAEIEHDDAILDVGAGTGYTTAVLSRLGGSVTGLESDRGLVADARTNLAGTGFAAEIIEGSFDGAGIAKHSFDVIVVEGLLAAAPKSLFPLLREGGRLVALIGAAGPAVAHVFVKSGGEVAGRSEFNTTMPPLVAAGATDNFVF